MIQRVLLVLGAAAALAACTEQPQTLKSGVAPDTAAFHGAQPVTFTAAGWKQGDRTSWEQQLKTRLQMGQNDYNKVN
jgi:ABC-type glycerol-3-phosphate transport system substrate-binding protein